MSRENSVRKNLNVWSDILKEESLCETLNKIDFVRNKDEHDSKSVNLRGVESYNYVNESLNEFFEPNASSSKFSKKRLNKKLKHFRNKSEIFLNTATPNNTHATDFSLENRKNNHLVVHKDIKEIKERLGPVIYFDESKRRDHIHVSELDSDEMVVKEIARQLREPKIEIICMFLCFGTVFSIKLFFKHFFFFLFLF